jgi:O-antigen/teichoic acid export membrane protein
VQEVNAAGFPLRLTVAWLACFGVAVALLVVMIPEFGATGAGAAVSVSYMVLAVLVHRLRARVRRKG